MNTLPSPVTLVPNSSYETTRFNALRHGVLSRIGKISVTTRLVIRPRST